ncbi:phosphodiester glycosidase family protein [Patescibacteria group bacterium]|nr:phosphodiester glycosidase family protein [Patescibacteria group bacterium]
MARFLVTASIIALLIFSGCSATQTDVSSTKKTNGSTNSLISSAKEGTQTESLGGGIEKIVHYFDSESTAKIILYKIPKEGYSWKIQNSTEELFLSSWYEKLDKKPLIIINGVYFDENNNPTGLLIENGKKVSKTEYDTKKSGFVSLSPVFDIVDTSTKPLNTSGVQYGMQSYPFLLTHGKEAILEDSGRSAQRTFIGTDTSGNRYVGVLFEKSLSLFELMKKLQEIAIEWDMVINVDGGTSTGLYANMDGHSEYLPSLVPVPNVITIEKK